MKKLLPLLLAATLLLLLWGCAKCAPPQDSAISTTATEIVPGLDRALELYLEFLLGKRSAKNGKNSISIDDIFVGSKELNQGFKNQYAFFDMNHDFVPELHVRVFGIPSTHIFTVRDNFIVWTVYGIGGNSLNDGAELIELCGISLCYIYVLFDFYGNEQLRIKFERGYDDHLPYYFEGVEVSREQWAALTEKYLSIGSDEIEWINAKRN